jgi:hypothetical protein
LPKDGDPRGTSILRAAYQPWNAKTRAFPNYFRYLEFIAKPRLFLERSEDFAGAPKIDESTGLIDRTAPLDRPEEDAKDALLILGNSGGVMVGAKGDKVQVIESKLDGSAFVKAMDWYDRQGNLAIIQNTRTLMEAESGSKADSQTGQDITRQVQGFVRMTPESVVEDQIFYRAIRDNGWGKEVADRLTPKASFGSSSKEDFAATATSVAALEKSGYLTPDQLPWIDTNLLGIVPRKYQEPRPEPMKAPPAPGQAPPDQEDGGPDQGEAA